VRDHAIAFAPGRVNLIGEHTDYNDGLALPFAIAQGVTVEARALAELMIVARAADLGQRDRFPLAAPAADHGAADRCASAASADGWRAFVRGAVAVLQQAGVQLRGAELEIAGTVRRGSGLSSSAALEVALCLALLAVADALPIEPLELARLCSRIENEWVGARTGLLDQIASLFGERDRALRIDFRSGEVRPVELSLGGFVLVTLDSGERHLNAASGYNQRREECAAACLELGLSSLRDATLEMAARLPAPLSLRVRHVVTENARVDDAVSALERGDLAELGRLLDASHASLRDCYEVSTPAVETAVGRLRAAGAVGARIVGGGFGGSVLGLLPPGTPPPPGAFAVEPGPGARLLD
jgi:galactokinase